jgi:hypothetical protein
MDIHMSSATISSPSMIYGDSLDPSPGHPCEANAEFPDIEIASWGVYDENLDDVFGRTLSCIGVKLISILIVNTLSRKHRTNNELTFFTIFPHR